MDGDASSMAAFIRTTSDPVVADTPQTSEVDQVNSCTVGPEAGEIIAKSDELASALATKTVQSMPNYASMSAQERIDMEAKVKSDLVRDAKAPGVVMKVHALLMCIILVALFMILQNDAALTGLKTAMGNTTWTRILFPNPMIFVGLLLLSAILIAWAHYEFSQHIRGGFMMYVVQVMFAASVVMYYWGSTKTGTTRKNLVGLAGLGFGIAALIVLYELLPSGDAVVKRASACAENSKDDFPDDGGKNTSQKRPFAMSYVAGGLVAAILGYFCVSMTYGFVQLPSV